ncbi:MAG: hypothetical protein RIG62_19540 [Cyclobacteriaceae bacterium]|jgi:hypothetical protein
MNMKILLPCVCIGWLALLLLASQKPEWLIDIPKTWDLKEIKRFHLPPPDTSVEVFYAPEEYYNSLPEHIIYKTYPVYVAEQEPEGYLDSIRALEPEVVFDLSQIKTQEDWIKAGEAVFHWPTSFSPPYQNSTSYIDRKETDVTGAPVTPDGLYPFTHYVVKEKGQVQIGLLSCANCHTRVMDDGSLVVGGQGNAAFDPELAVFVKLFHIPFSVLKKGVYQLNYVPWAPEVSEYIMDIDSADYLDMMSAHANGTMVRQGISISPTEDAVAVPSLIGLKDIKYLDKTGIMRHEGPGDLMRYAAFNQGMDMLTRYNDFIPMGVHDYTELPKPEEWDHPFGYDAFRYNDAQLYALAQYIYSLEPPENPNHFDEAILSRGETVFKEQGCITCHTPPLYTNNQLTPALGFEPPKDHYEKYDIFNVSVETDPTLAIKSRRGTGYYKIPSLRGLWYRGPYLHSGNLAKLEDLFDPARLQDDYIPTGYKPYMVETMAVKGHEFGMELNEEDKNALVAFLKTL